MLINTYYFPLPSLHTLVILHLPFTLFPFKWFKLSVSYSTKCVGCSTGYSWLCEEIASSSVLLFCWNWVRSLLSKVEPVGPGGVSQIILKELSNCLTAPVTFSYCILRLRNQAWLTDLIVTRPSPCRIWTLLLKCYEVSAQIRRKTCASSDTPFKVTQRRKCSTSYRRWKCHPDPSTNCWVILLLHANAWRIRPIANLLHPQYQCQMFLRRWSNHHQDHLFVLGVSLYVTAREALTCYLSTSYQIRWLLRDIGVSDTPSFEMSRNAVISSNTFAVD